VKSVSGNTVEPADLGMFVTRKPNIVVWTNRVSMHRKSSLAGRQRKLRDHSSGTTTVSGKAIFSFAARPLPLMQTSRSGELQ
jgi:hypothetical protein